MNKWRNSNKLIHCFRCAINVTNRQTILYSPVPEDDKLADKIFSILTKLSDNIEELDNSGDAKLDCDMIWVHKPTIDNIPQHCVFDYPVEFVFSNQFNIERLVKLSKKTSSDMQTELFDCICENGEKKIYLLS